jgi:hypothetical protein
VQTTDLLRVHQLADAGIYKDVVRIHRIQRPPGVGEGRVPETRLAPGTATLPLCWRPAFTGLATQPYSATEVDGWQHKLSRVSQNRAAVHRFDEVGLPKLARPASRTGVRRC